MLVLFVVGLVEVKKTYECSCIILYVHPHLYDFKGSSITVYIYLHTYIYLYIYIYIIHGSYGKYMFVVDWESSNSTWKGIGLDFWKPTLMIHVHLSDYMP